MAVADTFNDDGTSWSGAKKWVTITPSDTNDLEVGEPLVTSLPKAVAVGETAGTVTLRDADGNESTFYASAGQIIPCRPVRIKATGTTATPIIVLL